MNDPLSPSYRCVLQVGVFSPNATHHTVEFSVPGSVGDNDMLAKALREVADALVAPTVADPELT